MFNHVHEEMLALHKEEQAYADKVSLENPINARRRLVQVERSSPIFAEIEQLFAKSWHRCEKCKPKVQFIFEVQWPEHALRPYFAYRAKVQESTHAEDGRGNEKFLFHGTNRACVLGESPSTILLCYRKRCSLCSILRTSLAVSKCGTKNAFKRYGNGIYLTPCSSKADEYVSNFSHSASLRVMLINRVVIGNAFKTYRNAPQIVPLSDEYNSVEAEPGPESDLVNPETVIYDNDAVRPAYVIVYGKRSHAVPMLMASGKGAGSSVTVPVIPVRQQLVRLACALLYSTFQPSWREQLKISGCEAVAP
ncbi:ADP-ribosylation [Imleria badia]|nr:ADP-ribosylation [Imleria badia]